MECSFKICTQDIFKLVEGGFFKSGGDMNPGIDEEAIDLRSLGDNFIDGRFDRFKTADITFDITETVGVSLNR